jgi:cell division transport system ATP-binding protein
MPTTTPPLIQITDLKKYYGARLALSIPHLRISVGECIFITGHSGAGKSTFLKLLTCETPPSVGQCVVAGLDLKKLPPHQYYQYRQKIGIIAQTPLLFEELSVFDNVAMPLTICGHRTQDIASHVFTLLEATKLENLAHYKSKALSCGERQRIGIARALVHQPSLILADEPTGNLDPTLSLQILSLFTRLQSKGCTFIIASHDIHSIKTLNHNLNIPSRTLVLNHGILVPPTEHLETVIHA